MKPLEQKNDPGKQGCGMTYEKTAGSIQHQQCPVLEGVPETVSLVADATGVGVFLSVEKAQAGQYWFSALGTIAKLDRFTACSRKIDIFWMEPSAGGVLPEVPNDTQWLLVRRTDGRFVLLVPIIDRALRFCLGFRDEKLHVWADSGDPSTVQRAGVGVFLAVGDDPYKLQELGAAAVMRRLQTGKLRRDKPLPDFVDLFGWCTWNAFYREVSEEKVGQGLESFLAGGVTPAFLILDDGWLSCRAASIGGERLTRFQANEKFPNDLAPMVAMVKRDFGVQRVLVWHTAMGYWAGVDKDCFPEYDVRDVIRNDLPSFGRDLGPTLTWMGAVSGTIPPARIAAFYEAFHAHLAAQGVDGVKVDNQSTLELCAAGLGGRVGLFRAYRQGLEASCRRHFDGRLIDCMGNTNENHLMAADSSVFRSSPDFWPLRPETHGPHLYTNAQVGLWFGQFQHPDWDMFESGHELGSFHAASRAVSGSPVYVSDKPEGHDFDVLRKLVCSDGSVLRCTEVGRPSPDCLFHNPTLEDVLLKVFNFNAHGAVLGVFHVKYDGGAAKPISGAVSAADVPGLKPGRYAVLAHRSGEVRVLEAGQCWPVALTFGKWEIFTFAPIREGRAILGLADKYNSGGAILDLKQDQTRAEFHVRDGGVLVLAAVRAPRSVTVGGVPAPVDYDSATGKGTVKIAAAGAVTILWE